MKIPDSVTPKRIATGDGSYTLFSPRFNQHYHNPNGAVAESRYLFLEKNGLLDTLSLSGPGRPLTVLETGFGTGLNFLLLLDEYIRQAPPPDIDYHSVEAFPLDGATARRLNFGDYLHDPDLAKLLPGIFESAEPGMNRLEPVEGFRLHLFIGPFNAFDPGPLSADFLFHDPFSPGVNGELWTREVFIRLAGWSCPDAILSTYCAATKARGAMASAGWRVAREKGALGKREMTLASLNPEKLTHLKRVNEEILARRYREGDFDS